LHWSIYLKIALICDSINTPSGFGTQAKILANGLAARGHEIHVLGAVRPPDSEETAGITEWFADTMDLDAIDNLVFRIEPDACVAFSYHHALGNLMRSRSMPQNCPTFLWLPWEGATLPAGAADMFADFPAENIVHISNYSRKLWEDAGIVGGPTVYHAIDQDVFKPVSDGELVALREKWSEKLGKVITNGKIIVAVDRNHVRKRWDKIFDYVRRLHDAGHPVQLIANTPKGGSGPMGYDQPNLADIFGVSEHVIFTDFDWQKYIPTTDIAELYQMSDFRVSMSAGEGFGLPTAESMACGCPNIVPDHTAFTEVLGPLEASLIPVAGNVSLFDAQFGDASVVGAVDRTIELINDHVRYTSLRLHSIDRARRFDPEAMVNEWEGRLKTADPVRGTKYRYGWFNQRNEHNARAVASNVCRRIDPHASVKVFGSYLGDIVDVLCYSGLRVLGFDTNRDAIENSTPHSKKWTQHVDSYLFPTQLTAVAVMWDCLEQVPEDTWEDFVDALRRSPWVVVKNQSPRMFGTKPADAQKFTAVMGEKGMHRRVDIENMVASSMNIPMLPFQVWHSTSAEQVPEGFR